MTARATRSAPKKLTSKVCLACSIETSIAGPNVLFCKKGTVRRLDFHIIRPPRITRTNTYHACVAHHDVYPSFRVHYRLNRPLHVLITGNIDRNPVDSRVLEALDRLNSARSGVNDAILLSKFLTPEVLIEYLSSVNGKAKTKTKKPREDLQMESNSTL